MTMLAETIGTAAGLIGITYAVKDWMKNRKDKKVPHVVDPEMSNSEKHGKMHELIARHREMNARIKENHNLLASLKQTQGMGRQKTYVWEEIQSDKEIRNDLAEQIKALKVSIYGEKALNI